MQYRYGALPPSGCVPTRNTRPHLQTALIEVELEIAPNLATRLNRNSQFPGSPQILRAAAYE